MNQTYVVKVKWTCYGEYRIEAESETKARVEASRRSLPDLITGEERCVILDVVPANSELEDGA